MERTPAKIFLTMFILSSVLWLYASSMKNYYSGELLEFGTIRFVASLDPATERSVYHSLSEHSIFAAAVYPVMLLTALGYLRFTVRSFKSDGWLLMSAILLFFFIPVELYCFWLDWKLIGLNYWGEWPLEEFRKTFLHRVTALAGLPLIAQLCYFTIPVISIVQPLKREHQ
jgi:hypothetical protein